MAAAKKTAKKAAAKAADSEAPEVVQESTEAVTEGFRTYLEPGKAPDLTPGTPSLDPELEKIRDAEAEKLAEVKIEARPEPTIDPDLEKARDEQIKRETDLANKK